MTLLHFLFEVLANISVNFQKPSHNKSESAKKTTLKSFKLIDVSRMEFTSKSTSRNEAKR